VRRIVVVGGGIAGAESALTLARGLPADHVTLLSHSDVLRVMPDLVYVPAGVSEQRLELPFRTLFAEVDIDVVLGEVEAIDLDAHVARADTGDVPFDIVVVAPGASAQPTSGMQLQSIDDACALRERLDELFAAAAAGESRSSIVIRAAADDTWSPPAYEFAALLAARRRMLGVERHVSITLVTAEMTPFQWFDPSVADVVVEELRELGIELALGVPEARFDDLEGDLVVDFGRLEARHVAGLPGRDQNGWYATDSNGRVHRDAFVVGDAASHGFKAAFAVAWEARRMLVELGGDMQRLGATVGGVPVDWVEHHVDLGLRTATIRLPIAANLHDPWLGHDSRVELHDEPPDRLAGMLLGDLIDGRRGATAAQAHRALVAQRSTAGGGTSHARVASRPA
jgi:NADPH-dependent 2,4-dienoyl-CoA reductase/sulfur reductase-like enzyme